VEEFAQEINKDNQIISKHGLLISGSIKRNLEKTTSLCKFVPKALLVHFQMILEIV
jgi:hypothetical protein